MTVYEIRNQADVLVAEHVRIDLPGGKKQMSWRRHGRPGLDGLPTAALPLYGAQWIDRVPIGATVILCEGEAATEALWTWRVPALGTVTGASGTPGEDALSVLLPYDAVTWEDRDEPGHGHMERCARWLDRQGNRARRLVWGSEKGDDAADFRARGGTRSELADMIAAAHPWQVQPLAPPRPLRPRYERLGAEEDRIERARHVLVEVVERAWGPPVRHMGRSVWWHCRFHHGDNDPSFKVDLREPFFRCWGCGARGDVFEFKKLTEGITFIDVLRELAPQPRRLVDVW